ncbi:hypothetical protein D3C76_829920 [compost metagenome]
MKNIRIVAVTAFVSLMGLVSGCNSDSAEKFNGEWVQDMEGKGKDIPDKVVASCDTKVCEWKRYSGLEARMNEGDYGSPSVSNLVMVDGVLDFGMGRTATIKDGKLYFGGKVFSRITK